MRKKCYAQGHLPATLGTTFSRENDDVFNSDEEADNIVKLFCLRRWISINLAKSHIGQSLCSTSVEMQNIDFVEQQKFRSGEYMAA